MAAAINQILEASLTWLLGWTGVEFELAGDHWIGNWLLAALIHAALLLNVVAVGALFFIWAERKVAGRIQDRLGPTRVGGAFGWLQTLGDGIKLITKEDLTAGQRRSGVVSRSRLTLSLTASFLGFIALPFASGWVGQNLNHAAFFVLAVVGLGSLWCDPGRVCIRLEMVAIRRHARSCASGQLRSTGWPVCVDSRS